MKKWMRIVLAPNFSARVLVTYLQLLRVKFLLLEFKNKRKKQREKNDLKIVREKVKGKVRTRRKKI